jgi:hypothetical protein
MGLENYTFLMPTIAVEKSIAAQFLRSFLKRHRLSGKHRHFDWSEVILGRILGGIAPNRDGAVDEADRTLRERHISSSTFARKAGHDYDLPVESQLPDGAGVRRPSHDSRKIHSGVTTGYRVRV